MSTVRKPSWRYVSKGQTVMTPCEGGFLGTKAEEPGAVLELEGQPGVFVPQAMLSEALAKLALMAKSTRPRKR